MAVDAYPDEEGVILDGFSVGFAKCVNSIAGLQQVALGTTQVAGVISIVAGAAQGDSIALAMKAGVTDDIIPILLYGVAKMQGSAACKVGAGIESGVTAGIVVPVATQTAGAFTRYMKYNYTGTAFIYGYCLQPVVTALDEILVLINAS